MSKPERARTILCGIKQYDQDYGQDIPSHYPWTQWIRQIAFGNSVVRLIHESRIELGHLGKGRIGEHIVPQSGSMVVTVSNHGHRRFAANFVGDEVDIFRFQPGRWETIFGSDPGSDTTSTLPGVFEDDKDPLWRRLKEACERELKRLDGDDSQPSLRPSC